MMEILLKMSKLMNKLKFLGRYALKNIWFEKLKSLALLVIFMTIFIIVFLLLSVKPLVHDYYYHELNDTYKNQDLVITVDENSNSRFFSVRSLEHEAIIEMTPFLKINTLMTSTENTYVTVLAGNLDSLNNVTNNLEINQILEKEIIVTRSLANKLNLNINDDIYLYLDNNLMFKIKSIIEDDGLLSKNVVFIDKDSNMKYILEGLNLSGINPDLLKNIFNTVYLEVSSDDIIDDLRQIEGFDKLKVEYVYNKESVNGNINKVSIAIWLVFAFILLAVIFVLQGLLTNIFKSRIKAIGVIRSFGGKSHFYLNMVFIETFIYYLFGAILGALLTPLFIKEGLNYMDSSLKYNLDGITILGGLLLTAALIVIIIYMNYRRIKNTSPIVLTKENKLIFKSYGIYYLIVLVLFMIINQLVLFNEVLQGTFSVILIMLIGFILVRELLKLGNIHKSNSLFHLISLKNINRNKAIYHNLNIMLTSFLAILLIMISMNFNTRYNENVVASIKTDLMITNITHGTSSLVDEVRLLDGVKEAEEAYIFNHIQIDEIEIMNDYMVSLNINTINDYISLGLDSYVIDQLSQGDKPYIVLPEKYYYLHGYQIADTISLNISKTLNQEPFTIIAFHKSNNSLMSVTNMIELEKYETVLKNSVLINAESDKDSLFQELINKYQSRLYYITEMQQPLRALLEESTQIVNYISYISYMLIVCFVLTIINNSLLIFDEIRPTYQKLKMLGTTKAQFIKMLFLENMYIMSAVLISGLLIIYILVPNIIYLGVNLGVYLPLTYQPVDFIKSAVIFIVFYLIGNFTYFKRVESLSILDKK